MPERKTVRQSHSSGLGCQAHKSYALSCDEYEALWARCGGHCEACGRVLETTRRGHAGHVIDHDHRYGAAAVRGILCTRCNNYLGRLETPRVRQAFPRGPGRWFANYFRRAWFTRPQQVIPEQRTYLDSDALRDELQDWESHNRHLFAVEPMVVLVPTDRPAETAKILREQMSPQAFASLVRLLNAKASVPKSSTAA